MSTPRFERDQLAAAAVAAVGADDFGEDTWQEGLDLLLDGFATEADLNDIGVAMVETELTMYLSNRLGIIEWRRTHPEVADLDIVRPVFIVGQPRTGTSILHDLLAQDPANRAPLTWEVDYPVPPPVPETFATDERIAQSQATSDMADLIIPGFQDFHPLGPLLAQECVRMTAGDFRSMIFSIQYHLPTYNQWLLFGSDMAPAYRWHRRYLQHLQSGGVMGDRWLLKSPFHLWHLGDLLQEYPDALVIQTHRDPLKIVASISALAAHLRRMASDRSSVSEAAEQYVDDVFLGFDRMMQARADGTMPANQVIDVQFTDFMADPFVTIGAIYDQLGIEFTPEAEAKMRAFLAEHPGDGGGGGSRYAFANTGLDADELRARSKGYQEHFGVQSEPIK